MIQQDDEPSSFPVIGVGSDEDAIAVPLLGVVDGDSEQSQRYGVYVRRFYLLFLLSIVSMQQSCVWMTWSPVQSLVQDMYGWSSGTISLMAAWGPIVYIPVCILTTDLVDRLGMRATVTLAALLTFVGAFVPCYLSVFVSVLRIWCIIDAFSLCSRCCSVRLVLPLS